MEISNVGVVSPGDMGQAIAQRLLESGLAVHAALDGRSDRTRTLAREAGLHDCGSLERLVEACDLVISVIDPGQAPALAADLAAALRTTGRRIAVADLNAISPQTARDEERLIRDAGGIFIDGGVVGLPPRGTQRTRIYASGPEAALLGQLHPQNLEIRILSDRVGDASGIKMCYAALTKGTTALTIELLMAAHRLGIEDALVAELRQSRGEILDWQLRALPLMPSKAYRWVPEMQEIAKTFEELGLTRRILDGVTEIYAMVAATPLGQESPEQARRAARAPLAVTGEISDLTR